MPKSQRTQEEIEAAKSGILEKAANLMVEIGYSDFTMRKLAARLGITATTIYNYFKNKDDLFINLLIMGFRELYEGLAGACRSHPDPSKRLSAMIAVYADFGLNNANFYNLMYSWHVPKYNHYTGTAMEPVARRQLEEALKVPAIFIDTIKAYAHSLNKIMTDDQAVFLLIHYWSQIHGFVAGCNNTNLSYIHSHPISLKEKHLDAIAEKFSRDMSLLDDQGEKQ